MNPHPPALSSIRTEKRQGFAFEVLKEWDTPHPAPPPLSAVRGYFVFHDNDDNHYVSNTYYLRIRHLTQYTLFPFNPQNNPLTSCPRFTEEESKENRFREVKKLVQAFLTPLLGAIFLLDSITGNID